MGTAERPWAIDAGVARDLSAAIGWRPDDGVGALAARLPEHVPMGSTAKLAAIARDEVPPGDDPGPLARLLLEHVTLRASAPSGGAPSPSWSCWVACSVMAALVDAHGLGPVHVALTRRSDDGAPIVDFHGAVRVDVDGTTWVCDPYFGVAIALPSEGGVRTSTRGPLGTVAAERSVDGGWAYDLAWDLWDDLVLRFRQLGPALDPGDVRAMAAISVTHSGVPLRPYVRLHLDGGITDASQSEDGTGVLHRWTPSAGRSEHVTASWAEAVDAFAAATGVRPI